jgi:hypothetical protein
VSLPWNPRRVAFGAVKRLFLPPSAEQPETALDLIKSLSTHTENPEMSRSRDRIMANLDDMYREAFEAAKRTEDDAQMRTLDFAYRREQLYFEILLDIRDAMGQRQ